MFRGIQNIILSTDLPVLIYATVNVLSRYWGIPLFQAWSFWGIWYAKIHGI